MGYALRGSPAITKSGEDSTVTVTLPTHQTGDLLVIVACVSAQNSAHDIANPPSGWTTLYAPDVGGLKYIRIDAKIAASASETNPEYTITGTGTSQTFSACAKAWTGGPSSLSGIVHASAVAENNGTVHPYNTPALVVTENNTLILYVTTLSNDAWQQSGSTYPNGCTGLCVSDADANNALLYAQLGFLVGYAVQTTAANVNASSWQNGSSGTLRYVSLAVSLVAGTTGTKYLKALIHSSAAGASSVAGTVFDAPSGGSITGAKIGEFTGASFLGTNSLDGGKAKLLVNVNSFGGSALTTANTPHVYVRTSSFDTGIFPATVIEV